MRILLIALLIASLGILSIYSGTYQKEAKLWQQQALWGAIGLVVFIIMSNLNYRRLWDIAPILYGASIFLLFLVFLLGAIRLGAQRWLKIAWFNFQPSELAKLTLVILLAQYFSQKSSRDLSLSSAKWGIWRGLILPFIFVAIPMGLIVEQPDLGSAGIILFIFISLVYLAGVRLRYLSIFLLFIILSLPILWQFLRDYQKERLLVFLNPNIDPLGAGYTLIQSKITIGSGGIFGRGLLSGTQSQLRFLPEAHTDFIFATFAEEWGFLGSVILFFLYYLLIRQSFLIAKETPDPFGRLLAFGIALMLDIQIFINLGMTMGLFPVVGLPLPLMSYGGSSMVVTFMALGILANIDKRRAII